MTFSIMITTRNRAADLRRTCRVLRTLNPAPLEILITADGCTDDTIQMLKANALEMEDGRWKTDEGSQKAEVGGQTISNVEMLENRSQEVGSGTLRLFVNEVGQGSVASRDRMMREALHLRILELELKGENATFDA